jgi:hypothetical protein
MSRELRVNLAGSKKDISGGPNNNDKQETDFF